MRRPPHLDVPVENAAVVEEVEGEDERRAVEGHLRTS